LLGVADPRGAEPEHPDCLVAVFPQNARFQQWTLPESILDIFRPLGWQGEPNILSPSHVEWRWAEAAAEIVRKPAGQGTGDREQGTGDGEQGTGDRSRETSASLRRIIHQRRSAREMDGQTVMERDAFYRMLLRTIPRPGAAPFAVLPWSPRVHLAIFVHRVSGLAPGLYLLARDPAEVDALRSALKLEFAWETVNDCPTDLPLFWLASGDTRGIASRISCGQDIAADGCFSLGMLAEFERPLTEHGAWVYPRLFWECGMIGQVLYLEAEAAGLRGTGIGCFFDDGMHNLLGLKDRRYQSLYHFTVGGPLEDERLTTLPAYGVEG
jgi:nitroreductase